MEQAWQALAACTAILFFKMLSTSLVQGYHRISGRAFTRAEDARVFGRGVEPVPQDPAGAARAADVWRNDLENIPMFLLLAVAYLQVGAPPEALPAYCWTFTAARIAHSLTFLLGLQPWRFLAFALGLSCSIGLASGILKVVL